MPNLRGGWHAVLAPSNRAAGPQSRAAAAAPGAWAGRRGFGANVWPAPRRRGPGIVLGRDPKAEAPQ